MTTSLYYKDPKLQKLDENISKKLVKDLGISVEEYMDLEQERFNQLKKKEVVTEEAPRKKKDEGAGTMKKLKKKVTFSSNTKREYVETVRKPRKRSQIVVEVKKTFLSTAKKIGKEKKKKDG